MIEDRLMRIVGQWFESQHWIIETNKDEVVAVMPSGYGSGPAVVSITNLVKLIREQSLSSLII